MTHGPVAGVPYRPPLRNVGRRAPMTDNDLSEIASSVAGDRSPALPGQTSLCAFWVTSPIRTNLC